MKSRINVNFCKRRFTYALNLRRHIRTHTSGKPYKCGYCECTFAVSGPVLSHLRTHLGKNIHRCEFCPSTFPHFTELRTHLTTHKDKDPETRERNMTALKEEEAKLKQNLATKIQQPPKPKRKYTCNFCNKDFTASSKLKRHIRMHTGERPYSCSECGKSFSLKSSISVLAFAFSPSITVTRRKKSMRVNRNISWSSVSSIAL
ncbi:zinc finger protein 1 homolog isoform X2 [Eurosta solidaginis]|uniref:zinc finger protein 1 homolog isoform X2 n=1 Tax=Eurosta solidaginis TaxID=178769 RepID=UPI003530B657